MFLKATEIAENRFTDPVLWWIINQGPFTKFNSAVGDVLAAQASFVASEYVFSESGRLVSETRNRLGDYVISALMVFDPGIE